MTISTFTSTNFSEFATGKQHLDALCVVKDVCKLGEMVVNKHWAPELQIKLPW
jgi:hypothetical protein